MKKKFTMLLAALFLTLGTAWAEKAVKGAILSHEEMMALTEPTDIIIQNISGTNRWYFCGNKNLQTFETNNEAWFVWEPAGDSQFYLKKKYPTSAQGEGYLQKDAPSNIGAKGTAQKFTAVYQYPTDAPAAGTDAKLVRFVRADNAETWINCSTTGGTPVYNSGPGAYTMHNVYRLELEAETKVVGLKEVPTTPVAALENIETGYYLIKEVSSKVKGKPGGFMKATSESAGAVVTPQGKNNVIFCVRTFISNLIKGIISHL